MYVLINKKQLKELDKNFYKSSENNLKLKNMNLDDVEIILSMEFLDSEIPSRSFLDYKKELTNFENPFKTLADTMEALMKVRDDGAMTEKQKKTFYQSELNTSEKSLQKLESDMGQFHVSSFKKMMKDKDNVLQVIIKNQFVSIKHNVDMKDFSKLSPSIQDLISTNLKT